jgi:tRNA (guanine-N7-)-methyltransferase
MAQANPALNYVGIEVYEAGIGRLINSAHIKQLNNLKVMRGDAVEFLSANIADNSLARFQLFFPDPWHKKKHHKRRIVQQDFLNLLAKKLKIGSNLLKGRNSGLGVYIWALCVFLKFLFVSNISIICCA